MMEPDNSIAALFGMARALREGASAPRARNGMALPPLWLLTDSLRLPDPLPAAAALPAGCGVILRHYDAPDRARLARTLTALCRERGLMLLVGADSELARSVNADGVHLPEALLTGIVGRPGGVVTAAAHDARALERAAQLGADAALLSPMFATPSRPELAPLGRAGFARLAGAAHVPVYALGGVTPANAVQLDGTGAAGIAAIGAFSCRSAHVTQSEGQHTKEGGGPKPAPLVQTEPD